MTNSRFIYTRKIAANAAARPAATRELPTVLADDPGT